MGKVNIIVMLDEGDISAVKVNNELFFRKEGEDVVDFYNNRIIPLLSEKGIDFVSNYTTDNITVIDEKDYSFGKKDNINITEEQMEKIVNCSDRSELSYDEQLYLSMLYKKIYGPYDFYNQSQFESAKKLVWYIWRGETMQKLHEYKEFANQLYEDLSVKGLYENFGFDSYDNPLFVNNVIGRVVNGIKNTKVNIDTYSLITGRKSYEKTVDDSVDLNDMLEFENKKFNLYKDKCYKKSGDERLLSFSDNPFKNIDTLEDDKKKVYDELNSIYLDKSFHLEDVYWNFYALGNGNLEDDITNAIYINIPISKIYKLNLELLDKLNDSDISCLTKFTTLEKRSDGVTIYSDKENISKIVEIIKNMYRENPSLFSNEYEECIMTAASIGVPGVGIGSETNVLDSSHNSNLAYIIDRGLSVSVLNYILKNDDEKAKNAFINSLSHIFGVILGEDVSDKIENSFDEIAYKLLGALDVVPLEFEESNINSRNQILVSDAFSDSKNNDVPIGEEILFIVIKDAIKACDDPRKIVGEAEKEITKNADFYNVHPYNIAFNYDSDENKYGKKKITF